MRSILGLALFALATGCTDSAVPSDTTYRRLVDTYDSESACLQGGLAGCYQLITLCTSGAASVDVADRPLHGTYTLDGDIAHADLVEMRIDFDTSTLSSPQLPGRHAWEQREALVQDCPAE
ncbi:MAG TPA: hypothetical protein VGM39_13075 [Kofleriaceae bacterium]|jgi:hypothetical protein